MANATVKPAASAPPATAASSKHAVVKTRQGALGTYLVDGRGRTLYLFRKDKTRHSTCTGACAEAWPPVTTREQPDAEGAIKAAKLSTTRRPNGSRQVVYAGHPLYRYIGDGAAGDTNGEGLSAFGARWYALSRSGRALHTAAPQTQTPAPPPSYSY